MGGVPLTKKRDQFALTAKPNFWAEIQEHCLQGLMSRNLMNWIVRAIACEKIE